MTAPKATLIGELGGRPSSKGRSKSEILLGRIHVEAHCKLNALELALTTAIPIDEIQLVSRFHLSGGWDRRSTASGEREASDHAHHIWIVPAQRMEPLYSAVLRAYQQYRRLVRAVASSRRHPDFKEKRFCAHGLPKAHARINCDIHPTGNSQTFL